MLSEKANLLNTPRAPVRIDKSGAGAPAATGELDRPELHEPPARDDVQDLVSLHRPRVRRRRTLAAAGVPKFLRTLQLSAAFLAIFLLLRSAFFQKDSYIRVK
jgi:hypothetical protein